MVNRRLKTGIRYQKITTDTTEFKYYDIDENGRTIIKKLYLDPSLDMFNSQIISYRITQIPSTKNIMNASNKAIEITYDCKYNRTFHSDQGWAYQMKSYVYKLEQNKIFYSMSRKGNYNQNLVMEDFFRIMKQEMYYGNVYYSYDKLRQKNKYCKVILNQ